MRLIIAGSRTYNNYTFFVEKMEFFMKDVKEEVVLLCGEAKGVDTMGRMYALEAGWEILSFKPQWDLLGKAAGPLRNKEMAEQATHCICFWDGVSRGTASMIEFAKQYNLKLRVVRV